MKNMKFIFTTALIATLFSCAKSDYSEAYIDSEEKIDLVATLEVNRVKAAPGTYIDFTATLPQSFNANTAVTARITNAVDGSYNVAKVEVPAGTTAVKGQIEMPSFKASPKRYEGTAHAATLQIDGLAIVANVDGVEDPYRLTSDEIPLTLLDATGAYDFAYQWDYDSDGNIEPWLSISLDWEGPHNLNDLDLFVVYEDGETYEDSQSGNRFEGDFFNGNWFPDGVYYVKVSPWRMDVDVVNVRFAATDHHDTTTIIESTVTRDGGSQVIATITKTGGDSVDIEYVIAPAN